MADTNVAGVFHGFFLYTPTDELPFPQWDWHPDEVFRGLELQARLGVVTVWKGTQRSPENRAWGMQYTVERYIYTDGGDDWALVASKLEEVLAELPWAGSPALELGNAYLRLGRREDAIRAFSAPLDHLDRRVIDEATIQEFREVVRRLKRGDPLDLIAPLRNPYLE